MIGDDQLNIVRILAHSNCLHSHELLSRQREFPTDSAQSIALSENAIQAIMPIVSSFFKQQTGKVRRGVLQMTRVLESKEEAIEYCFNSSLICIFQYNKKSAQKSRLSVVKSCLRRIDLQGVLVKLGVSSQPNFIIFLHQFYKALCRQVCQNKQFILRIQQTVFFNYLLLKLNLLQLSCEALRQLFIRFCTEDGFLKCFDENLLQQEENDTVSRSDQVIKKLRQTTRNLEQQCQQLITQSQKKDLIISRLICAQQESEKELLIREQTIRELQCRIKSSESSALNQLKGQLSKWEEDYVLLSNQKALLLQQLSSSKLKIQNLSQQVKELIESNSALKDELSSKKKMVLDEKRKNKQLLDKISQLQLNP